MEFPPSLNYHPLPVSLTYTARKDLLRFSVRKFVGFFFQFKGTFFYYKLSIQKNTCYRKNLHPVFWKCFSLLCEMRAKNFCVLLKDNVLRSKESFTVYTGIIYSYYFFSFIYFLSLYSCLPRT